MSEYNESKRQMYEKLRGQLETERQSFLGHWRDLGEYILPRRPRWTLQDVNRGDRRNQKIIDSTATMAVRVLSAGMMSGLTSPSRPWFNLTIQNSDLAKYAPVQDWLEDVTNRMRDVLYKSNWYNVLPITYSDIGVFGTSAIWVEEDFDNVLHYTSLPIGSYYLFTDDKGRVRGVFREFRMTVRQVVKKFGEIDKNGKPNWDNFSRYVRDSWERGNYEHWVEVAHIVQENPEFNPNMLSSKYKKYTSCYYERNSQGSSGNNGAYLTDGSENKFLRESGYDYFPALAPRWSVSDGDAYGTSCPGMDCLGDVKQLQTGEKRSLMAVDKMINPPMTGPTILRNIPSSLLPGGTTWVDTRDGQSGFRPAHEVRFDVDKLEMKQAQVRARIDHAFYKDLFLMLSISDRREITAREVEERHEEKLLALGPVIEQANQDLLDPNTDIVFDIMFKQGLIPPPPPELEGEPLKVDYISIMAQAQKLVGISGIERFTSFLSNTINQTQDTSILDKVDMDELIDAHGQALSISSKILRTADEVMVRRKAKADEMKSQTAMETIPKISKAAKDLSGADMNSDTALTRIVNSI